MDHYIFGVAGASENLDSVTVRFVLLRSAVAARDQRSGNWSELAATRDELF